MQKTLEKKIKIPEETKRVAESFFEAKVLATENIKNGASEKSVHRLRFKNFNAISIKMPDLNLEMKKKIENFTNFFLDIGVSAPKIYLFDMSNKTMIIEDFGCNALDTICRQSSAKINEIYPYAIDVLIKIHQESKNVNFLETNTKKLLIDHFIFFCEEYLKYKKHINIFCQEVDDHIQWIAKELDNLPPLIDVVTINDYHSPNLFWLEQRTNIQRIGLIDLQDTAMFSPVMDLVSIIEDARVTVEAETRKALFDQYIKSSKSDIQSLELNYSLFGLIRNCKILGFVSKMQRKGESKYSNLIDRVIKYIMENRILLKNQRFKTWIEKYIS